MTNYFKRMFLVYWIAAVVCVVCRVVLKLTYTDLETGFYTQPTAWESVFGWVLLAAVVLLFLMNWMKKTEHDYMIRQNSLLISFFAVLSGLSIVAYSIADNHILNGRDIPFDLLLGPIGSVLNLTLGIVSGISFLMLALNFNKRTINGVVAVVPCIWQTILLITTFNLYKTLNTIADNLLTVLFMVFAALFLLGHARIACGLARRDGRDTAIAAGLCTSICGFSLVIPNYIHLILRGGGMPAPMLGYAESIYVLILSIYALLYIREYAKSIASV